MHGWHLVPISIHTLRMEGDLAVSALSAMSWAFQSTPAAWRVTRRFCFATIQQRVISIHTLRMEGDRSKYPIAVRIIISIHTLRMEGDFDTGYNILVS